MSKGNQEVGRAPSGQALVSDQAPAGLDPSGFDPSRDEVDERGDSEGFYDDDGRWWPDDAEWCDRCQGLGTANCYCGGDQCYCDNYGEMTCPQCDGEGYFVPTAAFKAAREQHAKWWRELHEHLAQGTSAGAETPQAAQPEGQEPGAEGMRP